jgi:NADH-quinone oxidoreductase subunit D
MARSVGVKRDLRLSSRDVYSNYNSFFFKSYTGVNGDCFDRYLIRMLEMGESLHIVNSVANILLNISPTQCDTSIYLMNKLSNPAIGKKNYSNMEDLINHFIH